MGQIEGECPVRQGRRGSAQGAHRGGGAPSLQAPGGGDGGSEHRWSCAVPAAAGSGTSGPLKGPSNSCDATDKPERAILAQRDPQQCSISPPAATTEARKAHRQAGAREPGRQPPSPCSPAQWRGRAPALPGGAPSLTPGRPPRRGPTAARFEFAARPLIGRAGRARAESGLAAAPPQGGGGNGTSPQRAVPGAEGRCAQPGGVGCSSSFVGLRFRQP